MLLVRSSTPEPLRSTQTGNICNVIFMLHRTLEMYNHWRTMYFPIALGCTVFPLFYGPSPTAIRIMRPHFRCIRVFSLKYYLSLAVVWLAMVACVIYPLQRPIGCRKLQFCLIISVSRPTIGTRRLDKTPCILYCCNDRWLEY